MWNSSILTIDRTLSGATTPGQSGPRSNEKGEFLRLPQSSSITGASPSDCLVSYTGHSFGRYLTPLQRCNRCILLPQLTRLFNLWVFIPEVTGNFHCSSSENKCLQLFMILRIILADLNSLYRPIFLRISLSSYLFAMFWECSDCSAYSWYRSHLHVPHLF